MHPRIAHPLPPSDVREFDLDHGVIHTEISPAAARSLTVGFLLLIFSVPLGQVAWELANSQPLTVLQIFQSVPTRASLRHYEESLEQAALARQFVQPRLQWALSRYLGFGSDNVVLGQDGYLYYAPGLRYVTGPGFLDAEQLRHRHKVMMDAGQSEFRPDPRPAIRQFHEECRQRGVRLLLLPIPDKAQLQPAQLSRIPSFSEPISPPHNPDYQRFVAELREQGVEVLDIMPSTISPADQRFLAQDTHWTPDWMDAAARQVAEKLRPQLPANSATPLIKQSESIARLGDLVDMLRLPRSQTLFAPQNVTVERVLDANKLPWQSSAAADVLVLGDSFCNIYSAAQMGWGDAAGFVEHLAYHLGRPLDRIVRNDAGAHATREMLAQEMSRGNDRLAGKKLVIWEFAARELAVGDWKLVPLQLGAKKTAEFYGPASGQTVTVQGVIRAISPAPRPGTVPYKDHLLTIHLADIQCADDPAAAGKEAVVLTWSMRDNQALPAARCRPGDVVRLRLQPWSAVSAQYDSLNRSSLDDEDLITADPTWAGGLELVK